jgi:hypothetical protein
VVIFENAYYGGSFKSFQGSVSHFEETWNDMTSSLEMWDKIVHKESDRKECRDENERKAYSVLQWIPFISTLYSLISSAVYGAKGCHITAKERAVDGAIDALSDVAMFLTGGATIGIAFFTKMLSRSALKLLENLSSKRLRQP